jgi:enamine deaminase RidA (YjgF/YER057c/UK114 family)
MPSMSVESRLKELGLELPRATNPAANYTNCVEAAGLLFVAGKGPLPASDGKLPKGKLGKEYTTRDGYAFARSVALDIIAVVKLALGDLERVRRVVKVQGFINATAEFEEHPKVLDGCSDLLVEVFGEKGVHARSVLGAASVRGNLPLIIESIFEVSPH